MERLHKGWTQTVLGNSYVKYIDSMGTDETIIEAARMSTRKGFLGWEPGKACKHCNAPWGLGTGIARSALNGERHPFVRCDSGPRGSGCETCGVGAHAAVHQGCPERTSGHEFVEHKGDAKLLEYLYSNRHMTPFEMCELHVEVKAPIFVFRELHRHRTFSINEMSARYVQMPNEHYVPALDRFQAKATGNKQADSVLRHHENVTGPVADDLQQQVAAAQEDAYGDYEFMLSLGVPKEIARVNTPVSRLSVMRWKTDLRNWLAMLTLRDHGAAQYECQQIAKACGNIIKELWPRTYGLWLEHTKYAVTLSASEVEEMKELFRGNRFLPREGAWRDDPSTCLSDGLLAKFK